MDLSLRTIFDIIIIIFSVVIHEVSHGAMAYSMGDMTAKYAGRLTLNPIKHLDFFGSFLLPLFLYFTTGFTIGYAKPVPYDPHQLNDRRWGPARVAFAGPASNIALALLFGAVFRGFSTAGIMPEMLEIMQTVILINLSLAVFNLTPIPPLDGHWLLFSVLPARWIGLRTVLYRYSLFFLFIFILFIFPQVFGVVAYLYELITANPLVLRG